MGSKKALIVWLFILIFSVIPLVYASQIEAENFAFVLVDTIEAKKLNDTRDFIISQGGKVAILMPPHVIIGWIPKPLSETLLGTYGIEYIYYTQIDIDNLKYSDQQTQAAAKFFNDTISGKIEQEKQIATRGDPLINDTRDQPPLDYQKYLENLPPGISPSPGNSDTMSGSVAVCLFFIESNGTINNNYYTWTATDVNNTVNRSLDGVLWWAAQASLNGYTLSFSVYYYPPTSLYMQQGYEPIVHPSTDDYLWINSIMANLGFGSGNKQDRTSAFNTWLKNYYGTNWAYSVFIGYNPSPAPSTFTNGYFAYAYLGGPYSQLLFRNDGWREAYFGLVLTHETGHIFWACDEYYQAGYGGCTSCTPCFSLSPRNFVPNLNCEYCNSQAVICMMRHNDYNLCRYTKYQIGWLPSPSESANVTNFTIPEAGVYPVTFTVSNNGSYSERGQLAISVSSGLEIIEADGLTINPLVSVVSN